MTSSQTELASATNAYSCFIISFIIMSLPLFSLCFSLSQGNVTFSCAQPVSIAVTFTDSQSFLQLPGLTSWLSGVVSVALQFRTWNKAGLLLTFDLLQQEGTVWLYLREARLRLQINKAGRAQLELSTGQSSNNFTLYHFAEWCESAPHGSLWSLKFFEFEGIKAAKVFENRHKNTWANLNICLQLNRFNLAKINDSGQIFEPHSHKVKKGMLFLILHKHSDTKMTNKPEEITFVGDLSLPQ